MLLELSFSKRKICGVIMDKSYSKMRCKRKITRINWNIEKFELNDRGNLFRINLNLKGFAIIYPDNTFYKGFLNRLWKKAGFGMLHLPDGYKYEGFLKNDEMNGKGDFINLEGFYYKGEFINNRANG